MKMSTTGIVTPINKDELKELLKETRETLATGVLANAGNPTFGAVDLWKLRKNNKTTSSMRRYL